MGAVNWDALFVADVLKILTKAFGMYPYRRKSKIYLIYSMIVFTLLTSTSGYILHNSWNAMDETSIRKIHSVMLTLIFFSGIFCAVKGFCSRRKVDILIGNYRKIERLIKFNNDAGIKTFSVKLILLNLMVIVLLIYDFSMGCIFYDQNLTWAAYHVNIYLMSLMTCQFSFHAFRLRAYLESIEFSGASQWKRVLLAFQIICDNIELLNDIYGMQVALMIASYIVGVLLDFDIVLKVFGGKFYDLAFDPEMTIALLSLALDNILVLGSVGVWLATNCEKTERKLSDLSQTSYRVLLQLRKDNRNRPGLIHSACVTLTSMSTLRKSTFHACGLFAINHSLIYAILGIIISNVVVLVQLK